MEASNDHAEHSLRLHVRPVNVSVRTEQSMFRLCEAYSLGHKYSAPP